jgi:glycosyltransferase involved in cell wall biosynthesis
MEWVIYDDSIPEQKKENQRLFATFSKEVPNIHYFSGFEKVPMGTKLNRLCANAMGDIIVVMDDDDYYPPTRVSTAVAAFLAEPQKEIAGCSKVYMCFTDEDAIYCAGPYSENHTLNCAVAFRASYILNHRYDDAEVCAVERVFTRDFTEPMIQLDSMKTILHMVHGENTFRGKKTISRLVKTNLSLADF